MATNQTTVQGMRHAAGVKTVTAPSSAVDAGLSLVEQRVGDVSQQFESVATAAAAKAKSLVLAHFEIAQRIPRQWDEVRQKLLDECRRPAFAHNKSALYHKPIGDGVEGLGIRFVEVAIRCMRNVYTDVTMIHEDKLREVWSVTVIDMESNVPYHNDFVMTKTVERSWPAEDGFFYSKRKNSRGKDTFTVPATEDDLLNKRAALVSKCIRTLGLRLVPGDLQDEAEAIIRRIREEKIKEDPSAARKAIIDGFHELNVPVAQLIEYVGHDLDTCSPAELTQLRGLYGAIRDGETSWAQAMQSVAERAEAPKTKKETPKEPAKEEPKAETKGNQSSAEKKDAPVPPAEAATPAANAKVASPKPKADERLQDQIDDGLFGNLD